MKALEVLTANRGMYGMNACGIADHWFTYLLIQERCKNDSATLMFLIGEARILADESTQKPMGI